MAVGRSAGSWANQRIRCGGRRAFSRSGVGRSLYFSRDANHEGRRERVHVEYATVARCVFLQTIEQVRSEVARTPVLFYYSNKNMDLFILNTFSQMHALIHV